MSRRASKKFDAGQRQNILFLYYDDDDCFPDFLFKRSPLTLVQFSHTIHSVYTTFYNNTERWDRIGLERDDLIPADLLHRRIKNLRENIMKGEKSTAVR